MTEHEVWTYLHILMFVFWLGTDMGVFISARKSTDPSLPFDTRVLLLHMALRIELLPRTMWKAALPLGVVLSNRLGAITLTGAEMILVWVFSTIWWGISMAGAWFYDKPFGHQLARITNWLTSLVGAGLVAIAISSYLGNGPVEAAATWLHWKIGLYGLINLLVVLMLVSFDPMGVAFGRLAVEGSKPEIEAIISGVMSRSTVIIWATYGLIALVGFIGITKLL
jgi:hypothetical protein